MSQLDPGLKQALENIMPSPSPTPKPTPPADNSLIGKKEEQALAGIFEAAKGKTQSENIYLAPDDNSLCGWVQNIVASESGATMDKLLASLLEDVFDTSDQSDVLEEKIRTRLQMLVSKPELKEGMRVVVQGTSGFIEGQVASIRNGVVYINEGSKVISADPSQVAVPTVSESDLDSMLNNLDENDIDALIDKMTQ